MNIDSENYRKYAAGRAKKSPILKNCVFAFLTGGAICTVAQGLTEAYQALGLDQEDSGTLTSVTLVFVAAMMTGLGIFDRIAKFAGAGTLVPITGFANAVAAPAIDTKGEGFVMGVGTKTMSIAGPVILYGTTAGVVYGVIYWLMQIL